MGFFSKDIKTMDDLFVHTLRDIYYAEKQIVKALPEIVGKASDPQLKQGFQTHLRETESHVGRLEEVFKLIDTPAKGVDCPAHQAHDRAEISGTVQATNPGDHAKGQGRQHQDDDGRTGPIYAGLARLFRLLRNTRGADCSHALGPLATAVRSLAPVENTTSSASGTGRTGSLGGTA